MRRKVLAALVVVMLFCNSVPVLAGNTLPINHGNKYVYAVDGGGEIVDSTFHWKL